MRRRNARSVVATDEWTSWELECGMTPPVCDDSAVGHHVALKEQFQHVLIELLVASGATSTITP